MSYLAHNGILVAKFNIKRYIRAAESYIFGCNNVKSIRKYYIQLRDEITFLVKVIKHNNSVAVEGINYLYSIENTLKKIYLGIINCVNANLDKIKILQKLYKRSGLTTSQRFLDELRNLSNTVSEFKSVYEACCEYEMFTTVKNTINNLIDIKILYIGKLKTLPRERISISQGKKFELWKSHIGENWFGLCVCCNTTKISIENFIIGHVLAVDAGGSSELSNLRPICQQCNSDMGTAHMDDYIEYLKLTKISNL
jgi:5-methylcytosine-specific restriction endonuclease McrA